MRFIADLHIHSRYSRATSKNLDLENIYLSARLKGIQVVGTGDATHPAWFDEINRKLVPDGNGLFRLKPDIVKQLKSRIPASCDGEVRFVLASEISNIYKKKDKTRKNHNLVYFSRKEAFEKFNRTLASIGNIHSDGRPILGLDAKDLLDIVLNTDPSGCLIPAHIWTPWFSVLGSKSGFDSITECFEDLSAHITAIETGLSSDPLMNWRVSALDGITLVSNSDAHSPGKLGREANLFNSELSYHGIFDALKNGNPEKFLGTVEFYPQEGKYHFDGHRSCNVRLHPKKTLTLEGICPECGKPLTLGVLHRVEALADRNAGYKPDPAAPFWPQIPLEDILADILQKGPNTKSVQRYYQLALKRLGPEMQILHRLPVETIESAGIPLLAQAVEKVRNGTLQIDPGFDGQFGRIRIFTQKERDRIERQIRLFSVAEKKVPRKTAPDLSAGPEPHAIRNESVLKPQGPFDSEKTDYHLNSQQQTAVDADTGATVIVAGPGTGKTNTLIRRMIHLIETGLARPHNILAITFTNKAAREIEHRIQPFLDNGSSKPMVATFHGFCLHLLRNTDSDCRKTILNEADRAALIVEALRWATPHRARSPVGSLTLLDYIVQTKQQLLTPDKQPKGRDFTGHRNGLKAAFEVYQRLLKHDGAWDFEDLIYETVRRMESDSDFLEGCRQRFRYIFVDEFQDLNYGQYRMIRLLAPPDRPESHLFVIGDPDQSIYGFRGSNPEFFARISEEYPCARQIRLIRNYRCAETVLKASHQVIRSRETASATETERLYSGIDGFASIDTMATASEKAEAVQISKQIEKMIGGYGFHSVDTGRIGSANLDRSFGFSDFAILFRTRQQGDLIADALDAAGIPLQIAAKQKIVEQKDIAALLSLLRITEKKGSFFDFERILPIVRPSVSRATMEVFRRWSVKNFADMEKACRNALRFPVSGLSRNRQKRLVAFFGRIETLSQQSLGMALGEKLRYLIQQTPLDHRLAKEIDFKENFEKILWMADQSAGDSRKFLEAIALNTDTDFYRSQVEKVTLMTLHAAKGLEFPVVFVAGCEDGLLPYRRDVRQPADVEEERRLFYVAMTRAKERLILTWAKKRRLYGRNSQRRISPFIRDIEASLLREVSDSRKSARREKARQMPLF